MDHKYTNIMLNVGEYWEKNKKKKRKRKKNAAINLDLE